ncbi:MAG: factor-independent urate hydroxylase [Planctomycetota bacterium]
MPHNLTANAYGKSRVRLTKVVRDPTRPDHHDVYEFTVNITLTGDFAASYTDGDNTKVIATDSQKNTVYVLARENDFDSPDAFAKLLATHFVETYEQVIAANVRVHQTLLTRVSIDGTPHPHAFVGGTTETRTARCSVTPEGTRCCGGISGMVVLKSAGSVFVDFVDDRFRTLPDTTERIFATTVESTWRFTSPDADFNAAYDAIRPVFIKVFAENHSLAVQQTLLEMGEAALDAAPAIDRIDLEMPNQHRVPFNLEPFGHANDATIFVTTDEPAGMIRGTVERG